VLVRVPPFVLGLLILASPVRGQEATGLIEGRILGPGGTPVVSARVDATGPALQQPRRADSDARGYFRLRSLPVGRYRVRVALVGYRPIVLDSVPVQLGSASSIADIHLLPQVTDLGEIVVHAEQGLLDLTSAAAGLNLDAAEIADLPAERNFRSIVGVAALADESFLPGDEANVAGGSGPENAYFLDGVNITDPHLGATSANFPYNFVREIRIRTGGYEAEFGRATGGIVDVITPLGGNRLGGQVFGFFTGDALSAEPRFPLEGAEESEFSEYDVGGSVGGPVLRDRLWYFLAYNPRFRGQSVDVRGPALPDDRLTEHLFASKLTWQAGPHTDVAIIAHGDPSSSLVSDLTLALDSIADETAVAAQQHGGGAVLLVSARHRLGNSAEAALGMSRFTRLVRSEAPSELGRTAPLFRDLGNGVVVGGLGIGRRESSDRTGLRLNLAAEMGRHAVKAGVEYEDNHLDALRDFSARPGSPGGVIQTADGISFLWAQGFLHGSLRNRVLTGYLQDSWRLRDRLTLNLGMRWDGQFLIGADGHVAQRFTDQWQPRVGFIYALSPGRQDKLFGSYGRFYEQIPLNLALLYYSSTGNILLGYDHDPRDDPSGADTLFDFATELEPSRDLRGQSLDEFTLGYERLVRSTLRIGLRAIHRDLRWAIEDAINPATGEFELGNPGHANLAFTPKARHTYTALALTLENAFSPRLIVRASYVLSRTWGNYEGLYDYPDLVPFPNTSPQYDFPGQYPNSTGLLPNDRPHVLKLSGSWRPGGGLTLGTTLSWMSGTPRNEFGATPVGLPLAFLQPRGSAGRTESVLDLNLRFSYALQTGGGMRPRVYLDLFHVGNPRSAVAYDDVHYLTLDDSGMQSIPNPTYGRPLVFQPPMSGRIGLSLDFGAAP
jgi:Carboxypeptidase regulatory-like domain/TonB dependent receptor